MDVAHESAQLANFLNNIGVSLCQEGKLAAGIAAMRRSVNVNPHNPVWRLNLAAYLAMDCDVHAAAAIAEKAIEEDPTLKLGWDVLGLHATILGDHDKAIKCYERAAALGAVGAPQSAFDATCARLRAGMFAEGWRGFEGRGALRPSFTPSPLPRWNGAAKGHVYVWAEEGVGDKIQFARFLPWVKETAGQVTFATDPSTLSLFWGYTRGQINVIEGAAAAPEGCDYQIGIASLPGLYGVDLDRLPPDPGLLTYSDVNGRIEASGLRVGIVWAGNAKHPNDRWRSLPFELLLELASDPRTDLFSLQCGPRAGDIAAARAQRLVTDLSGLIEFDWSQCASLIKSQIDLLVTADTGVAHVAAALNVPTFVLLSRHSDWRWLWDRDDSPWYPSIRLFRQDKFGDWKPVVARVRALIAEIHRNRVLLQAASRNAVQAEIL